MDGNHPITPPDELVAQWECDLYDRDVPFDTVIREAYRAGADWELESCCEWISEKNYSNYPFSSHELRTARRPKPPSLKKQALIELGDVYNRDKIDDVTYDIIRKALEQLDG